jgi:hypothetical protein
VNTCTLMAATTADWRLIDDAEKDLDFATVFDDEDFLDLFLSAPRTGVALPLFPPHPAAHVEERAPASRSDHAVASHGDSSKPAAAACPSSLVTSRDAADPSSGGVSSQSQTSFVVPPAFAASGAAATATTGLMNIVMLVDPVTDQVTLPRQDVIAGEGNAVVTIGPTVLSNFSKLDISSLTSEFLFGMRTADCYSSGGAAAKSHHPMEVEPSRAAPENKFLPISSFSLQSDLASSWNPQLLAVPSSAAAATSQQQQQQQQPYALGSMMFPSMSLIPHPQGSQQPCSFEPSHAAMSMSSLAPDHPPGSMMAAADNAGDAAAYRCVSESSSLDGGSVQSFGGTGGGGLAMAAQAAAAAPPVPNAVAAPLRALSAYNFFFRDERGTLSVSFPTFSPRLVRQITCSPANHLLASLSVARPHPPRRRDRVDQGEAGEAPPRPLEPGPDQEAPAPQVAREDRL